MMWNDCLAGRRWAVPTHPIGGRRPSERPAGKFAGRRLTPPNGFRARSKSLTVWVRASPCMYPFGTAMSRGEDGPTPAGGRV
jgi:hypothetical protein